MKDKTNQVWNIFTTGFLKYFSKTSPTQLQYQMTDLNEQIFPICASIYKCIVFLFISPNSYVKILIWTQKVRTVPRLQAKKLIVERTN